MDASIKMQVNVKLSGGPKRTYAFNTDEVLRCAQELGLTIPIFIVQTRALKNPAVGTYGSYAGCSSYFDGIYRNYQPPVFSHYVEMASNLSHDMAGRTLIHELTHALQCERDYDFDHRKFFREYAEERRAARCLSSYNSNYENLRLEREPRANEEYASLYNMIV